MWKKKILSKNSHSPPFAHEKLPRGKVPLAISCMLVAQLLSLGCQKIPESEFLDDQQLVRTQNTRLKYSRWERTNPVAIHLDESFSERERELIVLGGQKWNQALTPKGPLLELNLDSLVAPPQHHLLSAFRDDVVTVHSVDRHWDKLFSPHLLATTLLWGTYKKVPVDKPDEELTQQERDQRPFYFEITDADIFFNRRLFEERLLEQGIQLDTEKQDLYFKAIMLHELGHLLGLSHYFGSDESIMGAGFSKPAHEDQIQVHPADRHLLRDLYSH